MKKSCFDSNIYRNNELLENTGKTPHYIPDSTLDFFKFFESSAKYQNVAPKCLSLKMVLSTQEIYDKNS